MSLGTNFTGLAQDKTAIPTGSYGVLVANRADFTTLSPTTYGEINATIAIAGADLYQIGYVSQATIEAMIEGDKKANIGQGDQEVNISYAQELKWEANQADSLDEKALQEIEDSELVLMVVDLDAITVTTATLASNGTIAAGSVYYIFDHCFVQARTEAKGGEKKLAQFSTKKTNLPKRYAYLGEGKQITVG